MALTAPDSAVAAASTVAARTVRSVAGSGEGNLNNVVDAMP